MKKTKSMFAVVGLVMCGGGSAWGGGLYTVTDLGLGTYAAAINSSGQVTGTAVNDLGQPRAFRYADSQLTLLGTLGGDYSFGAGISDNGAVVGFSYGADNVVTQGFYASSSVLVPIDHLPGAAATFLSAINPSGTAAVGYGEINSPAYQRAYSALQQQIVTLNPSGVSLPAVEHIGATDPADTADGYSNAVNDSGVSVGSFDSLSSLRQGIARYQDNTLTLLPDGTESKTSVLKSTLLGFLPGGTTSEARAINNNGMIVGYSNTGAGDRHAVVFSLTDSPIDISGDGTLDTNTIANGVNDLSMVVGTAYHPVQEGSNAGPVDKGFIYQHGQMLDLNALVSGGSDLRITSGNAINKKGQIAATAYDGDNLQHGVLLTPVSDATLSASAVLTSGTQAVGPLGGGTNGGSVSGSIQATGTGFMVKYNPALSLGDLADPSSPIHAGAEATFELPGVGPFAQAWELSVEGGSLSSATLTFQYDPSELAPGTDESTLRIYHFDTSLNAWTLPANEVVDTEANTISFSTNSFSPFVLGEAAAVPEPGTMSLLLIGSGGLLVRRSRGRRRNS